MITPNWDIHPEMISHTRVIDTKVGKPFPVTTEYFMENWLWTDGKSADQLADYMAYALRILKNVDFRCEGITTPGGFGNQSLPQLAQGTLEACRDVFQAEIPHYFRHLFTDETSVAPRVEYASGLNSDDPRCVVSIIGCTGDWFGGWDGLEAGSADKCITEDGKGGRMPEVIARNEPAIMVCHWPGIYFNGDEVGFKIFQEVVKRLHQTYNNLIWMKLSEISRYWAAKELTDIRKEETRIMLNAPFQCPNYTLRLKTTSTQPPKINYKGSEIALQPAKDSKNLSANTWCKDKEDLLICFTLNKGAAEIKVG